VGPGDHVLGSSPDALTTFVEFGDYECPYCGRAHHVVRSILHRFRKTVLFAFRHFPLAELHSHAAIAALAVESAGAQGKFWPMHNTLFENQDALEVDDLVGYAEALGLNVDQFTADLENQTYLEKVRIDFRSGVRSGVSGTPTFFIDEVRFDGSWDLDSLGQALEEAVRRKKVSASAYGARAK